MKKLKINKVSLPKKQGGLDLEKGYMLRSGGIDLESEYREMNGMEGKLSMVYFKAKRGLGRRGFSRLIQDIITNLGL